MEAGRWPTRPEAEALLFEFTQSEALRRHGRAVEEAMRAYARRLGVSDPAEVERWGIVGLGKEHIAFTIEALNPIAGEIGL